MDNKDKDFEKKLMQNIEEKRAEQEYGAEIEDAIEKRHAAEVEDREIPTEGERRYHPMSEEEAKRMLAEDVRQTEANLKDLHSDKHKKNILILVIVAIILCIGMLIAALMIGNKGKDDPETGNTGGSQVEERPEEEPEEGSDLKEIALDDELVRELYGQFDVIKDTFNTSFYRGELYSGPVETNDEKAYAQNVKRNGRLSIAYGNSGEKACRATMENGGLVERYDDFILDWPEEQIEDVISKCVDGEEVRQNFEKIFGEKIELTGCDNYSNDKCGDDVQQDAVFTYTYSPSYDEFYYMLGGAGAPGYYKRKLVKAEGDEEKIYLYEQAVVYACLANEEDQEKSKCNVYDVFRDDQSTEAMIVELPSSEVEGYLAGDGLFNVIEKMRTTRWSFKKNSEGKYVYDGMEIVE